MFKNLADAQAYIAENDVKMVDFKVVDINGRWRHITIPAHRLDENTMKYGIGFDGSNYGYAPVERSDMAFIPDLASACIEPFAQISTLSMIGDVMVLDPEHNKPFDQYPRNVLKRAVDYMKDAGIADEMIIGPEFEFHVFDNVRYETMPHSNGFEVTTRQAEWTDGAAFPNDGYKTPHKGGYHICLPQDVNSDLRGQMCMTLERLGVPVKYHHHEVGGCGQMEIETELGDVLGMADNTMIVKYVVKNEAKRAGKTATFLPKPVYQEAGNGMHVHMHLFKGGQPLFYDEKGYAQLSEFAMYFMGGLLAHINALCALTNPSTNSYKRLIPGYEAPVTRGFATANRSAVIRIPAYAKSPMHKRFELRNPDATCNPYYAYAAILMAGLDGVKNKIDPVERGWGPYDMNLFTLSDEEKKNVQGLPTSLRRALDALEQDYDFLLQGGVFSETLVKLWLSRKRAEMAAIDLMPTAAEYKAYYDL